MADTIAPTAGEQQSRGEGHDLQVSEARRVHQREWFDGLHEEATGKGRPFAVIGANVPHELFLALDIPCMTNVWYSAIVGAKRLGGYYSKVLEDHGYHGDLGTYGAFPLAVALDESETEKPWGGFPDPAIVVTSPAEPSSGLLADYFHVPHFTIERPIVRAPQVNNWEIRWNWEDAEETYRLDVMVAQYQRLIAKLEKLSGNRLDLDRLREILDIANRHEEYIDEVREMLFSAPKLPVRLAESISFIQGIQWHRGTEWALDQARAFRDEVRARVDNEQWVCPNEKYRLMYIGVGLWQQMNFFTKFEESHGVVFVRSNYLSMACDAYLRYGLRDPIRTLAGRYATFNDRLHLPPWAGAWAAWEGARLGVSGALQIESGRGLKFVSRALETAGLPVLDLPTDPIDSRSWDDAKMQALMEDFIENRLVARQ
jgi:benzoyl-CoA reductase subunit B